jgi:hypothetical protein
MVRADQVRAIVVPGRLATGTRVCCPWTNRCTYAGPVRTTFPTDLWWPAD